MLKYEPRKDLACCNKFYFSFDNIIIKYYIVCCGSENVLVCSGYMRVAVGVFRVSTYNVLNIGCGGHTNDSADRISEEMNCV